MDEPILMKLFTAVVHVYDLWVCMKEDNQGLKCIKGDNSRVIVICAGRDCPFWIDSQF